jgi:SlyX protein
MNTTETADRIVNIEMKLSHQDVMLEELHQVIYRQQAEIDVLHKKLNLFEQQLNADAEIRPAGEKPPHY